MNGLLTKLIRMRAIRPEQPAIAHPSSELDHWEEFCFMFGGEQGRPEFFRLFTYLKTHPLFRDLEWYEEDGRLDPECVAEIGYENCGWIYQIQGNTKMSIEDQFALREEFGFDL